MKSAIDDGMQIRMIDDGAIDILELDLESRR